MLVGWITPMLLLFLSQEVADASRQGLIVEVACTILVVMGGPRTQSLISSVPCPIQGQTPAS